MQKGRIAPALPQRAKARSFPSFVLVSQDVLNLPQRVRLRRLLRLRPF
jgi:hypothetical protein